MIDTMKTWISDYIRSVLESTIRVAVVSSVDPVAATVRVKVSDADDLISHDLRVLVCKTHKDKDYWMPDIGDQVLCFFLPFGLEQGFVAGSFYSEPDPVPVENQDKRHVIFSDETAMEYDRKNHHLDINVKGTITIHADEHITITAPRIDLNPE